jgi:hypothetical protein
MSAADVGTSVTVYERLNESADKNLTFIIPKLNFG